MSEQKDDLSYLVDKARSDSKLAAAMVADLEGVIRQNNLAVDPNTEEYQALAIKMYSLRTGIGRALEELHTSRNPFGSIGSLGGFYGRDLVAEDKISRPSLDRMKKEIIDEIRGELKNPKRS